MIEATGTVTVLLDAKKLAYLDVAQYDEGQLYQRLLGLIGQEVFILVLPKEEMLAACSKCEHLKSDHCIFYNWDRNSQTLSEPYMTEQECQYTKPWHDYRCKCKGFQA